MKLKIGLFGGSFNPIHHAHIHIADFALKELSLDYLYFIPNFISPFKSKNEFWVSTYDKFFMIEKAIENYPQFLISDFEIQHQGKSYSINTVKFFHKVIPNSQLFFIIGDDLLENIDKWFRIRTILKLCKFVVYNRVDNPCITNPIVSEFPDSFIFLKGQIFNISSSKIHYQITHNLPIKSLIPEKVADHIKEKKLYGYRDELL